MGKAPEATHALAAIGLSVTDESRYRIVLRHAGAPPSLVASALGTEPDRLAEVLAPLTDLGLVDLGQRVEVPPPDLALAPLISTESRRARAMTQQLDAVRELLPSLRREHYGDHPSWGDRIAGEIVAGGGEFLDLWIDLARHSDGEVLQLRPDQWRLHTSDEMNTLVSELLAQGRRLRTLYPALALSSAPEMLRARAALGEEVRLVAELPARLVVFGTTSAIVPLDWDVNGERRIVVRQPGLVKALRFCFDTLWAGAVVVPGPGEPRGAGPTTTRALLLERMAAGDKDEQIARKLGLSLRTVRRRIAEVQAQLGAANRFQAGVEAVRRGWL
ncbi:MAG: helix-turn-helix domain-containing protein [Actinomycetota bacterium]|nr:helix-turn-helix domain-containing protein [Actinomycetota bacterium]